MNKTYSCKKNCRHVVSVCDYEHVLCSLCWSLSHVQVK